MQIRFNSTEFLLGIIVILIIVLLFKDCVGNSAKKDFVDPTLHHNSDGSYTKQIQYISGNLSELKKTNDSLFKVVNTIKGSKTEINTVKVYYHTDTLRLPSTIVKYNDNIYGSHWSYITKNQTLRGISKFKVNRTDSTFQILPDSTEIIDNKYSANLVTGITLVNGKEEIFVKSNDPNLEITSLQGFKVQRKIKHFVLGPSVGYGITGNKLTPYFGLSVSYKLIEF